MKIFKTILAVAVVAAALVAIPASGQTSGGSDEDSTNAALMALVENQREVIASQQDVIESLEALVKSQQLIIETQKFLLNSQPVQGGSDAGSAPAEEPAEDETEPAEEPTEDETEPARQHTEAEKADAAIVCGPWVDESDTIAIRRGNWVAFAAGLEAGIVTHITLEAAVPGLTGERDRIAATIPLLSSDDFIKLMSAMEQASDEIIKAIESFEPDETLIELINEAVVAFDALEAGFVALCDLDLA